MERNYEFRKRLSVVHKSGRRDPAVTLALGEVEITSRFAITVPEDADSVLLHAARDLEDYFFTSMGVSVALRREGELAEGEPFISYRVDPTVAQDSYRVTVAEGGIVIVGGTSRMAAQAGYYLEDVMNLREAPFLPKGEETRTSLYPVRMAHSGYGLDMYPTEHIVALAHAGVTALLVFIKGVDTTPHGYHDFNDLCLRAAEYGVDVYAYSYLQNLLHPEDEAAPQFYEELYGGFFDRCPYFRGIVFVGESFEFPSKDPNTTGIRRLDNRGPDGKPLVTGKPNPGWWPCYDYPMMLNLIKPIIKKRCPDIDIVFWSYNWNRAPAEARRALIENLPKDVTLQATFEMGETPVRDGIPHRVCDYTMYFVGPGYYFSTEAEFAAESGLRFYSMTNTGGRTWDVATVPFLPVPYRWLERYRGMRDAHDRFGLSGTMECHHYGFYPSFITELAKWAFHSPTPDLEEVLGRIVDRDFSPAVRERVLSAYRLFGDAMEGTVASDHEQYGPLRMGPSYPLILCRHSDVEIPTVPYAHFGGNKIANPVYGMQSWGKVFGVLRDPDATRSFMHEIEGFRRAAELYTEGCDLLREAVAAVPEGKREEAERTLGMCEFIRNTYRTVVNAKEFYLAKLRYLKAEEDRAARRAALDELLAIAKREEQNALDTLPLVERDSALGYEPSMEYMCDPAHIEWKLGLLRELIDDEIPSLYRE